MTKDIISKYNEIINYNYPISYLINILFNMIENTKNLPIYNKRCISRSTNLDPIRN